MCSLAPNCTNRTKDRTKTIVITITFLVVLVGIIIVHRSIIIIMSLVIVIVLVAHWDVGEVLQETSAGPIARLPILVLDPTHGASFEVTGRIRISWIFTKRPEFTFWVLEASVSAFLPSRGVT